MKKRGFMLVDLFFTLFYLVLIVTVAFAFYSSFQNVKEKKLITQKMNTRSIATLALLSNIPYSLEYTFANPDKDLSYQFSPTRIETLALLKTGAEKKDDYPFALSNDITLNGQLFLAHPDQIVFRKDGNTLTIDTKPAEIQHVHALNCEPIPQKDNFGKTIIDPGHGGYNPETKTGDSGFISPADPTLSESKLTVTVWQKLAGYSLPISSTRTTDVPLNPEERQTALAGADTVIHIHASDSSDKNPLLAYIPVNADIEKSRMLACALLTTLLEKLPEERFDPVAIIPYNPNHLLLGDEKIVHGEKTDVFLIIGSMNRQFPALGFHTQLADALHEVLAPHVA